MMRLYGIALGVCILASPAAAQGPSFDCAKASTSVENAICASAQLSRLDREMTEIYVSMRNRLGSPARERLRDEQRTWLAERNRCGDSESCLAQKMLERIDALATGPAAPALDMPAALIGRWMPYSDTTAPDGVRLTPGLADFGRNGRYEIEQVRPGGWVFRITGRSRNAIELMCGNQPATYVAFMPARIRSISQGEALEYQFTAQADPLPEPDPSNPMTLLTGSCSMAYYVKM